MKELSIEKKAKAYDKVREKIAIRFGSNVADEIFSQFEMSEDEKIRKELLEHCINRRDGKQVCVDASDYRRWADWLEKQGTPAKLSEEEQNRFAKGVLSSCALSFINYLDAHKYEGKMCVSNGECEDIENAFQNAMWDRLHRYYCKFIEKQGETITEDFGEFINTLSKQFPEVSFAKLSRIAVRVKKWLEKQGKQKPISIDIDKMVYEFANTEVKGYGIPAMIEVDAYRKGINATLCLLLEYGAQLNYIHQPNKVEPKFKVGDWITDGIFNCKITDVLEDRYIVTTKYEKRSAILFEHESRFRLWTIQDAKPGDVLCYRNEISLYKHNIKICIKQEATLDGFVYYCCYDGKRFIMDSLYSLTEQDKIDVHPATKEQRDQLEKAMADAGYTFDFEKKELKKIEQKPITSLDMEPEVLDKVVHDCIFGNEKPAWSEEDEKRVKETLAIIETLEDINKAKVGFLGVKMWLKSLKDRVLPQSGYNPYKEVVESIAEMCKHYDKASHSGLRDFYDNVKVKCRDAKEYDSLFPQNTWKPSDEQMKALRFVKKAKILDPEERESLNSLYIHLKKLK